MSYAFDADVTAGVLWVRVSGSVDRGDAGDIPAKLTEIVSACLRNRCAGILFDLREASIDMDDAGMFRAGQTMAETTSPGLRLASLRTPGDLDADSFFRVVAENRGLVYRAFDDGVEAMEWLKAGRAPDEPT